MTKSKKQGIYKFTKKKDSEIRVSDPPEGSKTIPSEPAVGDIPGNFKIHIIKKVFS
jgi:hypothetical protein